MPIRPDLRHWYDREWAKLARQVKAEARWRCEQCGVRHGDWRPRRTPGLPRVWGDHCLIGGEPHYRVVLTVAHLDHDPSNRARENLKALCQRCHLAHDRPEHLRRAAETRARQRAEAHRRAGQLELV